MWAGLLAARGRTFEQSRPAPPTWGDGGGRCLAAPRVALVRRRPRPRDPRPFWAAASPPRPRTALLWTMGPLPRLWEGEVQRQRSAARHGARRPESKGGGEERETQRMAADAATGGQLPRPSNSLPSAPPPRQGRSVTSSLLKPCLEGRGFAHKEQQYPHPCRRRGPPGRARLPTPAQPESLRGQGLARGAPS